jgi:hypothetical protein
VPSDSSTTIAIAGIAVAGLSTVLAPVTSSWLEGRREARRFEHEQHLRDIADLRQLFDEALVVLDRLSDSVAAMSGDALTKSIADGRLAWERFYADRREAERQRARLAVRLGSLDGATHAIERGVRALNEIASDVGKLQTLATIQGRDPTSTFNDDERLKLMESIKEHRLQYENDVRDFVDSARARFGVTASSI